MSSVFSGYTNDGAASEDSLAVTRDTRLLARLVLSQHVEPPLSIGVFGGHGTGRSFFLHLLQRDLDDHASDSQLDLVHVSFNALLNVETNPWIALVDAIYRSLEELASDRLASVSPGERDKLFKDLGGTARRLISQALARVESAESTCHQARVDFKAAKREHKKNLEKLAGTLSWQRWQEIEQNYWPSKIGDARRTIKRLGKRIGVSELDNKPEDLHNVLEQAKSIEGISSIISASITATPVLGTFTLIFLVVLTVVGLVGMAYLLKDSFSQAKELLDAYGKTLSIIGSIFGTFGVLALVFMRNRARFALNRLRQFIDNLRNAEREADRNHSLNKALIEEDVAVSRDTLANRREHMQRTQHDYVVAKQEYENFLEPGILRRLIEFYRGTLVSEANLGAGIVPILREDIEALTQWLMQDGMISPSVGAAAVKGQRQSRIVVYMDDFDRCPPEHVFAILQATNLLLSTPLFVVVMVMNPVSTLRALQPTYKALLGEKEPMESGDLTGVNALDYLGQLIQIPFWLSGPNHQQIEALVTETLQPFEESDEKDQAVTAQKPVAQYVLQDLETEAELSPEQGTPVSDIDKNFSHAQVEIIRSLMLALTVTPRTVKRFVNLCRLVNAELETYDRHEADLFDAVATLLAIVVGLPAEAPRVFETLDDTSIFHLEELLDRIRKNTRISEVNQDCVSKILESFGQRADAEHAVQILQKAKWFAARHSFNVPPSESIF